MTSEVSFDPPPRAVLGCIQIATDFVLDTEGPALVARFPGVEFRSQKLRLASEEITAETYERSARNVVDAVAALLPVTRQTVVGLSCTSMSFTLGPERVDCLLREGCPSGMKTTDMARAQAAALRTLKVSRVSLLTPYIEEVSKLNAEMLRKGAGVEVVRRLTMGLPRDELTSLVSLDCIRRWVFDADCDGSEAIVIGCSAFRACPPTGFLDDLESKLRKPVVTSTQAFLWAMLRSAGISDCIDGYVAIDGDLEEIFIFRQAAGWCEAFGGGRGLSLQARDALKDLIPECSMDST